MTKKDIILENIFSRRSIRKYSEHPVSHDDIQTILKAGMYAPSAVNKQPWHFIVFDGKDIVERIIVLHPNAKMLREAPVAILVCGDVALAHSPGYMPIDCAAATQNMLLAAHGMGLGTVWIGIYPREERVDGLREIFKLPENIVPFSVVSLGYPAEEKETPQRFNESRVHYGFW
jgi:nitroreductase